MIPKTLQGAFDKVKELLEEAGIEAPMFLGGRHLAEHAAPPRIVWVPTQDLIVAPAFVGDHPRRLFDSQLGISVHCWGKTHDDAIALRDAFIRASKRLQGLGFEVSGGGFYNPNDDAWIKLGEVYALSCSLRLPIYEVPPDEVTSAPVERAIRTP